MSLLVEIATRADVPLESVVRVLTREPVNDDQKSRVLAVLDHLDAEESRVLQRFALAAVHDALPPGGFARLDHEAVVAELVEAPLELPEAVRFELEQVPSTEIEEAEVASLPAAVDPAPLVQLGAVLTELSEAVRELRHETDSERRERVDDLAVLIDLITKGWEGVDRRLGRVERQLGRLEPAPPARALPVAAAVAVEPPPLPEPEPPPPPPDEHEEESTLRRRLPLFAALAFGIAVGAVAALDLPSRLDASAVVGKRGTAEAAQRAQLPAAIVQQTPMMPVPDTSRAPVRKATVAKPPAPRPRTTPAATTAPTTTAATATTTTSAARPSSPAVPPAATTSVATTTQKPAAPRLPSARTTAPPPRRRLPCLPGLRRPTSRRAGIGPGRRPTGPTTTWSSSSEAGSCSTRRLPRRRA